MRLIVLLLTGLLAHAALAQDGAPTDCDRQAANPEDPDRIAAGVDRAQVDLAAAITACEARLAAAPADSRARYQLARVLFYAGQVERASAEMKASADAGYRQAQFVYGALISNRREGAPGDICITERYWLQSARNGRQAARVSYVRHVLNGRFDGCERGADSGEMRKFLVEAAGAAVNYYERMLIEDLTTRLDAETQRAPNSN